MKEARSVVSFILAIIMAISLVSVATAADSYEVIFGDCAEELWKDGLMLGSGGSFNLDKQLTRSEGAVMVVRLLGKAAEAASGTYSHPFNDVPDWASPYVGFCYQKGILKGISDTEYGSSRAMTASQYTTLMLRILGYKDNVDFTVDTAVAKAREIHLLIMDDLTYERYFSPTGTFLRDQAVLLSHSALNMSLKDKSLLLKSTISMPGQPTGDMPTFVAGVPNSTVTSGSSLCVTGSVPNDMETSDSYSNPTDGRTNEFSVEREYGTNGVLGEVAYYRDDERVASIFGSASSMCSGSGWYMISTVEWVGHYWYYSPNYIHINSENKDYQLNSNEWRKDPFIVNNDLEPVIDYIMDEMFQEKMKLQ